MEYILWFLRFQQWNLFFDEGTTVSVEVVGKNELNCIVDTTVIVDVSVNAGLTVSYFLIWVSILSVATELSVE